MSFIVYVMYGALPFERVFTLGSFFPLLRVFLAFFVLRFSAMVFLLELRSPALGNAAFISKSGANVQRGKAGNHLLWIVGDSVTGTRLGRRTDAQVQ